MFPCPICNSNEIHSRFFHTNGYDLAKCRGCGFMWIHGAPDFSYDGYGGYLFSHTTLAAETRSTERHWGQTLRSLLAQYGPAARLLDIGCGAGYFVHYSKQLGFDAHGMDPSAYLRDMAQRELGLLVVADTAELVGRGERFDVITLFEVIEHVPPAQLHDFLRTILGLLEPGGTLLGSTPNGESLNVRLLGTRDPVIWPPSHASYFTPSALDTLFRRYRLSKRTLYTYGVQPFRRVKERRSFITAPEGRLAKLPAFVLRAVFYAAGQALRRTGSRLGYTIAFVFQRGGAGAAVGDGAREIG